MREFGRTGRETRPYNATVGVRSVVGNGRVMPDGTVLYLNEDEKRTRKWFQVCDHTVPLEGTKFVLIRSIACVSDGVKHGGGRCSSSCGRPRLEKMRAVSKDRA